MLGPIFALNVTPGLLFRVDGVSSLPVPPPQLLRIATVGEVGLRRRIVIAIKRQPDGQPFIVAARGSLQLVHARQPRIGNLVDLPFDVISTAGQVEQEGNSVGPTHQGIPVGRTARAHVARVT